MPSNDGKRDYRRDGLECFGQISRRQYLHELLKERGRNILASQGMVEIHMSTTLIAIDIDE